ncbi:MAG: hypothetical protein DRI88_13525 [Bacteroidetes bacterium]|nr:MAG: hypothetical protein DRI88_13525 [Bacteroidota bacterium]
MLFVLLLSSPINTTFIIPPDRLTKDLVIKSFEMACMRRNPAQGLIFHSDRGSQYASEDFRKALVRKGFTASMSGKGNCYDNTYA